MLDGLNKISGWMRPRYNELTTYIIALACFAIFVSHSEFRSLYGEILSGGGDAGQASISFFALGLIALFGFFLSIVHVFIKRKKSNFEKICMGVFAAGANGLAGIVAGIEMLPAQRSIWMVLPVWNIFMGLISLYQIGLLKDPVSDEDATPLEVVIASITLLTVFVIAEFVFHLTWAMTFSLCMVYSSTVTFFITWIISYFHSRSFTTR